jgi:hypothetical protein
MGHMALSHLLTTHATAVPCVYKAVTLISQPVNIHVLAQILSDNHLLLVELQNS